MGCHHRAAYATVGQPKRVPIHERGMIGHFLAVYEDKFGTEKTSIFNNGKDFLIFLRGRWFWGDFQSLSPATDVTLDELKDFPVAPVVLINSGGEEHSTFDLQNYKLTCEMPIPVNLAGHICIGQLIVKADFRAPTDTQTVVLQITLRVAHLVKQSSGKYGEFFSELSEINSMLPAGSYIQSCTTCRYALDNPFFSAFYGSLGCFRGCKEEIIQLKKRMETTKDAWLFWSKRVEGVQETYLCSEYEHGY